MKKTRFGLAALAASALLLTACSGGGDAEGDGDGDEVVHLTVATYGSGEEAVIDIAEREGWFEEAGIEVEKVNIGGPPAVIAATQSGEVDIAMLPGIPMIRAIAEGVPLTIVGAVDGYPEENPEEFDSSMIFASSESDITEMADLEGATIAIPARGAKYEVVINSALDELGIDTSSVEWVTMDFSAMLPALEDGSVDAAPLIVPLNLEAMQREITMISSGLGWQFSGAGPADLWVADPGTIEDKGDAIRAFRDASYRAGAWANEHPEEVKELAVELSGLDVDPADMMPLYFPEDVNVESLEHTNQRLIDLGYLDINADFVVLD